MSENKVGENGQELLLPTWLTKKYLEKVLRDHEKDESINVHKFNGSPATAKGNNYASVMLRINVEYEQNAKTLSKSMVIKTIHQDESSAKILEEHGTHHKEMTIYRRIIPEFQCLLEAIGDTDKLCPYTYKNDDKNEALIFQDLKESGYELANRKTGVDWSHVELYLRKIAKFHACSKVLMEKNGETFPEFQRGLMHKDVHAFEPFFKLNMEALAQEVGQWIGYEQYSQKLYKLVDLIIKQGAELFLRNEQQFNVLIHGDSWVANMMFKYNEQAEPIDVILVNMMIDCFLFINTGMFYCSWTIKSTTMDRLHLILFILSLPQQKITSSIIVSIKPFKFIILH